MELTKKVLRDLKMETGSKLKKAVITDLLSQGNIEEIKIYIKDVASHGCVSGMVAGLIYYSDTEKFFIKHQEEILDLFNNYKEEVGEYPSIELNANNLAWFGYETIVYNIASEYNLI
jgi:hypothetical protein